MSTTNKDRTRSRLQIVAVGDAAKITDILRAKGTLEVFDADGNPMK